MENNNQSNVLFKNLVNHQSEERKQTLKEYAEVFTKKKKLFLVLSICGFVLTDNDYIILFRIFQVVFLFGHGNPKKRVRNSMEKSEVSDGIVSRKRDRGECGI